MTTNLITALPTKLPTWERKLHEFIESRKTEPFAWGKNDCCLFAADAVLSMTGVDIAGDFRGKYTDEASCMKLLASLGYSSVEDMIRTELTTKWQMMAVQPTFAHRGDILLCRQPGGPALCIVGLDGKHSLGVGESGLMKVTTYHDGVTAWRIPYAGGVIK